MVADGPGVILLDTCILIQLANGTLPGSMRANLVGHGQWTVSALSAWEIGIKQSLGKLPLRKPMDSWWQTLIQDLSLRVESFTDRQAVRAGGLPPVHADPFDRGIIATALDLNVPLATVDTVFAGYCAPTGLRLVG